MVENQQSQAVLLSWSGGKDSCLALRALQRTPGVSVQALLTTVTRETDRIGMHRVRRTLLRMQAASIGLPLEEVLIPSEATNEEYEAAMGEVFLAHRERGVKSVAFGDLFLDDIRSYRERLLTRHGMTGLYPLWGMDTGRLMHEFIALGFKAIVVCVDSAQLPPSFAGRVIDAEFLRELPAEVDPCGEKGEFHTFVFDGPPFQNAVAFSVGDIVSHGSFWFCDLLPRT